MHECEAKLSCEGMKVSKNKISLLLI